MGRSVTVHLMQPGTTTDCQGAHRCPDLGLGGVPPTYQGHAKMLLGVHTGLWGPYTLVSPNIR